MPSSVNAPASQGRWISLWVVALVSLTAQLALCQFFSFGQKVPLTIDINPSNLWTHAYHFPPDGSFEVMNWLGVAYLPQPLNPFSIASALAPWFFFTFYAPFIATLSLLAMAAFLRELELSRPAALFGGVIYAWQGDLLPFIFPAHFGYITTWPFYAIAAWGALRAQRTHYWAYSVISGAACGIMVELQPDRGAIASLLVAGLYIASAWHNRGEAWTATTGEAAYRHFRLRGPAIFGSTVILVVSAIAGLKFGPHLTLQSLTLLGLYGLAFVFTIALFQLLRLSLALRHLVLCAGVALFVSLASFLALFQSNIVGVKLAGEANREQTYKFVTQYSLAPAETLTYLVPGFFGWYVGDDESPYWGWIGEWPDYPKSHKGPRNSNNAISTTGTVATVLALIGTTLLLPGAMGRLLGPGRLTERQVFFSRVLLGLGLLTLVLSWGWHTPLYKPLFELPLMDKWRNPLKWLEMTNFALVVLSAIGAQHLIASVESTAPGTGLVRERLRWFFNGSVVLMLLALMFSYPYTLNVLSVQLVQDGFEPTGIANIMGMVHKSLFVALAFLAVFSFMLFSLWRPEWLRGFSLVNPWLHRVWQAMLQPRALGLTLALGMSALGAGQLGWVASHFVKPVDYELVTRNYPLLDELWSEGNTVRVSVLAQDPILNSLLLNQFMSWPHTVNKADSPVTGLNAFNSRIACLDISAASRYPDDIRAFFNTLESDQQRLWFLSGVKNVVVPQDFLAQMRTDPAVTANIDRANGYMLAPTGSPDLPSHALVIMRDYLAKATFVPGAEIIPDGDAMLRRLKDPAWNPRASILLNAPPSEKWIGSMMPPSDKPAHAELKVYTPNEIEVVVTSDRAGYLLINDQYDPDWETEINGRKAELLRGDFLMRAVPLPPGNSTVKMHYVAHYRVAGLNLPAAATNNFCDLFMLAAWIVPGLLLWRRKI